MTYKSFKGIYACNCSQKPGYILIALITQQMQTTKHESINSPNDNKRSESPVTKPT